jgi:hypothetical protein
MHHENPFPAISKAFPVTDEPTNLLGRLVNKECPEELAALKRRLLIPQTGVVRLLMSPESKAVFRIAGDRFGQKNRLQSLRKPDEPGAPRERKTQRPSDRFPGTLVTDITAKKTSQPEQAFFQVIDHLALLTS